MKREFLKEYFKRQYSLLVEQEEEEPADDAAEDEAGGDEPAGEEGGEEEAAEDGDVEVDEEDRTRFQKSIDDKLQALLIDIESDAIKSAEVQKESYSIKQIFLNEQSEADVTIDTDKFASEVARLILNFDAFLDIEQMMLSKVRSFLLDKHGEEVADEVEKLLSSRHDIKPSEEVESQTEDIVDQVPIAVGATSGGGG